MTSIFLHMLLGIGTHPPAPGPAVSTNDSNRAAAAKNVMSYEDYRASKGKQWKSLVSKSGGKKSKSQAKETNVTISIGLYQWHPKEGRLKPRRGKRMALVVSSTEPYASLREKAVKKWKDFHSDCFDEDEDYLLLLENFKEALFLPGSCKEFFSLKRYHEELGRDYNKIILFLCTRSDYQKSEGEEHTSDDEDENLPVHSPGPSTSCKGKTRTLDEFMLNTDDDKAVSQIVEPIPPGAKKVRTEEENDANHSVSAITSQINSDEVLARELQLELDSKECTNLNGSKYEDLPSIIKSLEQNIDQSGQFFLVIRRGITIQRLLTLWQRESKRNSPEKIFRVKYVGEQGIDTGAMSKECLAQAMPKLGAEMFPNGSPVDSVYNIQNGKLRSCGELVATSIVQGGPPPCFLHKNVFEMLVDPNIDLADLKPEKHLTESDQELLTSVKLDLNAHTDFIIENGYTGVIDSDHKEDIVGTIMVNMIGKRLLYLKEFEEGMKLFGVLQAVRAHTDAMKSLFLKGGDEKIVDANYVFSIMHPEHSLDGSSRKANEEQIMDNFQDFLMSLEDESITGYSEAITWAEEEPKQQELIDGELKQDEDDSTKYETADLTPPGVLGWLTGQRHKPLDGSSLLVTVQFDHECMLRNPDHTICFPTVRACGRVLTFPVAHMTDSDQFRNVFLLAYCKGGAFANV